MQTWSGQLLNICHNIKPKIDVVGWSRRCWRRPTLSTIVWLNTIRANESGLFVRSLNEWRRALQNFMNEGDQIKRSPPMKEPIEWASFITMDILHSGSTGSLCFNCLFMSRWSYENEPLRPSAYDALHAPILWSSGQSALKSLWSWKNLFSTWYLAGRPS